MSDKFNNRGRKLQKDREWKFTFLGGMSDKKAEPKNRANLASKLSLSTCQVSDRMIVTQILSSKDIIDYLNKIGLTLGLEILVISRTKSGSVIISIQNTQIGLSADIANEVIVTLAI